MGNATGAARSQGAEEFDTTKRMAWLDQVVTDERVSPLTFKVAYRLAGKYIHKEYGKAWMSHQTLAKWCGVPYGSIRRAMDQLIKCGHLKREIRRGRLRKDDGNTYWPIFHNCSSVNSLNCSSEDSELSTGEHQFSTTESHRQRGALSRAAGGFGSKTRKRTIRDVAEDLDRASRDGFEFPPPRVF